MPDRGARTGKLRAEVVPVGDLDASTIEQMWSLFDRYYARARREKFVSDLKKKRDVILLVDGGDGSVQGFSTLTLTTATVDGRRVLAIFSGDTVIDEAYWGQHALQERFYRYVVARKLENPRATVYWFLISRGYRTYLLLSRNYVTHWPRYDRPTPPWERRVTDALATELFADAYRPEEGIVRFGENADVLKAGVAPIDPAMMAFPDIAFFAEKNPGHVDGDELCCLGLIDARSIVHFPIRAATKALRRAFRKRAKRAPAEPRVGVASDAPPASGPVSTGPRAGGRSRAG